MDAIVSRLVNTLINLADEEFRLIVGVPEEIDKLRETLCSIKDFLKDAERRQITDEGVKRWLSRLMEVMYDADDILDEYRFVAEKWASQENRLEEPFVGCRMLPICGCFGQINFTHEIGSKIRDVNQRLEQINKTRQTFKLEVDTSEPERQNQVTRVGRETSSAVKLDIVGEAIETKTRNIVDSLMRNEENRKDNVVVHAIVGLGGIGKTTLAQNIFNDDEIKAVFPKPMSMWVCMSQESKSKEKDLLREIISQAGGHPGEAQSKQQLQIQIKDALKNRKFLLVLDDVWDGKIWDDWLYTPLQVGAVGSRVLVTTRGERVAKQMRAQTHSVDPLSLDDGWSLLCKKVDKDAERERFQGLKDIGKKIVEKCQGLPLAITVIGGVLCGEFKRDKWEDVERNSIWSQTELRKGIHPSLFLSYEDLPSHLRQCFLYCSLFREDSILDRESLVQLWVAEGFVIEVEGEEDLSPEEIAQGYFDELVQRSLIQSRFEGYCALTPNSCDAIYNYTMHCSLRSMCHFLASGESSVITNIYKGLYHKGPIKLRRLSIVASKYQDIKSLLRSIQYHKSVRTLLLDVVVDQDDRGIEAFFNNFLRLRVIHQSNTSIWSLPKSVGNLLHLRYLNLSHCEIRALPKSIASLKSLQFLILERCYNLQTLPKGVVELRNLRTLNLFHVPLMELPSGIAKLEHLNVVRVTMFSSIPSDNNSSSSSCSLEEIIQLRKIRELCLYTLGACSKFDPNVNGSLKDFKNLALLTLNCDLSLGESKEGVLSYTKASKRIQKILDVTLHPPSCVRQIKISDFSGRQFPRWLMSSSIGSFLPNLTNLVLRTCSNCSLLPPLGKLPNLEMLDLINLPKVTRIDANFLGHEIKASKSASSSLVMFPRLKEFHLLRLHNLEVWHWVPKDGGTMVMPQLNKLTICECPKLLSLPEGLNRQASHLIELEFAANNLNSISGFPFVKKLLIIGETSLKIVSDLPALEVLEVRLYQRQSLSLPDWLVDNIPQLTSLHELKLICRDKKLLYGCLQNGLYWPTIKHIPVVKIIECEDYNLRNNCITSSSYINYGSVWHS